MHLSRREKGALAFGVLGGLLWGAVAALRTRPLPAALRVFTNAGPNIACAFLAACLLMLGVFLEESRRKGKQPPVSTAPSVEGDSPDPEEQPPEEK